MNAAKRPQQTAPAAVLHDSMFSTLYAKVHQRIKCAQPRKRRALSYYTTALLSTALSQPHLLHFCQFSSFLHLNNLSFKSCHFAKVEYNSIESVFPHHHRRSILPRLYAQPASGGNIHSMLKLSKLTWQPPEGGQIIKGMDLAIPDGKLVVLTGPNGGGKTTLAKLIAGLETPTSGQIFLDGKRHYSA